MSSSWPRIDDTLAAEPRDGTGISAEDADTHELERGASVGRYMVLGKLGAGGMGIVYAAYDPELDRRVALKLLLPHSDGGSFSAGRARLLREAQALAKLSHPNVVAVHDVGTRGQGVWVAMELVVGETLGIWAGVRSRRWPEKLRVLTEAARGVAAAHDAGLVHRDLKPDNVMVGSDGRVRVMDFGLAHGRPLATAAIDLALTAGSDSKARPELAALALRLTQIGAIQGTPAYMAPEQWLGQEAQAAADQFGWSIVAWELLYGERPFGGDTVMKLAANVLTNQRRPPPKGHSVPGWLRRVIERGLATDPAQRWSTMEALLTALGRGVTRSQAWVASTALAGIAALAAGASYRFAPRESVAVTSCRDAPETPEDLWSTNAKVNVERALMATGVGYAEDVWRRVNVHLGDYATAWASEHATACEQHIAGTQSSHLLDLRNACLARRKSQASQLIEVLAHADAAVVENAVQAVAALPSIGACADVDRLLAIPVPDDPATVQRVEVLRAQLARAGALEATGQYQAGLELASEVRAAAAAIGYAPLDAEASMVEGSALLAAAKFDEADTVLSHAIGLALTHDLPAIATEATAKRIFVRSELGRPNEAIVLRTVAEALLTRAGGDGSLAALLNNNLGAAYDMSGDNEQARVYYERSLDALKWAAIKNDPIVVAIHHNLGIMYVGMDQLTKAAFHYRRAVELSGDILGTRHPLGAHPLAGLAEIEAIEGRTDDARHDFEAALILMEASHGTEHPYLLGPLAGLGRLFAATGDNDEARRHYRRVVQIADKLGLDHPLVVVSLTGLAALAALSGDRLQAEALSERAARMFAPSAISQRGIFLHLKKLGYQVPPTGRQD